MAVKGHFVEPWHLFLKLDAENLVSAVVGLLDLRAKRAAASATHSVVLPLGFVRCAQTQNSAKGATCSVLRDFKKRKGRNVLRFARVAKPDQGVRRGRGRPPHKDSGYRRA